jgi:glycine/D-amino acid oxidase-like deaminating enzyme
MTDEFDVVVIGAGLAGLCCAGELAAQGRRPLLICETAEVGAAFPVRTLGGANRGFIQHITWQASWDGGWWYGLARRLNIPLRLHPGVDWEVTIAGTDLKLPLAICPTARSLTELLGSVFPIPDPEPVERVLQAALAIPFDELKEMHDVGLGDWLDEQGADEMAATLILLLASMACDLPITRAREHMSVFGGFGVLRLLLCGEGTLPMIYPNIREGLCIPLAEAIEQRGGEVRRRAKVARVLSNGGRVTGLGFADGSELECTTVAIATGNPRIAELLDPLPQEAVGPIEYLSQVDIQDFNQFYLLSRPVATPRICNIAFDPATMSMLQGTVSLTEAAPWTTEPGKQLVMGHRGCTREDVEKMGGPEAVFAAMAKQADQQFPGLIDAIEETAEVSTRHHWFAPLCVGPKLPRASESVDGLFYVGDGSRPCAGIWTEAAASCGILGARDILTSRIGIAA